LRGSKQKQRYTDGSQQEFYMFDTHLVIVEHHSFEVPEKGRKLARNQDFDVQFLNRAEQTPLTSFRDVIEVLTYKFDGDLLVVQQIRPLENHTK
jgi:hypothetical protein